MSEEKKNLLTFHSYDKTHTTCFQRERRRERRESKWLAGSYGNSPCVNVEMKKGNFSYKKQWKSDLS